jgi:hypothetical protein
MREGSDSSFYHYSISSSARAYFYSARAPCTAYCAVMPAALMTWVHLAISLSM